jgi:hypothetical protein
METELNIKKLNEAATTGGRILSQPIEAGVKKLLSESTSPEYTETLVKTLSEMLTEVGPLNGEVATQHKRLKDQDADSAKKFDEKIKAKAKAENISYADAAIAVASEDAEGFDEYRVGSYIQDGE